MTVEPLLAFLFLGLALGLTALLVRRARRSALERDHLEQNAAMLRIAGKGARLGGWTIDLPDRTLTWSDENCAIHDVPPGYKPTLEEGVGYFPPEYRSDVIRRGGVRARRHDFGMPVHRQGRRSGTLHRRGRARHQ